MQQTEAYPVTLQAVIDWVAEGGGAWDYEESGRYIDFSFSCEGYSYTARAVEEEGTSLTLSLIYEIPVPIDELTLRRRLDDVDFRQKFGAFMYFNEQAVVVWRDTISSDEADDFDSEAVDDVLAYGMGAFSALRTAIADLLGMGAADAKLASALPAGRA